MLIKFLEIINSINENLFFAFDKMVESFDLSEWLADAIIDSFHILPLLFFVFLLIEFIEYFYSNDINILMKKSEKTGPIIGSLAAILPQCGFSVIASTLYIRKLITKGTLISIYLATSDEAIPILLAEPTKTHYILPIIGIKLVVAICAGYIIDFILKDNKYIPIPQEINFEEGCCHHSVSIRKKRDLIWHPLKHTFNIFIFILAITIFLNFIIYLCSINIVIHNTLWDIKFFEPIITAFFGLIPNCATSIALTLLLIKGSISFGAAIAGLLSNSGLGLLILFRHNANIRDNLKILGILLTISMIIGLCFELFSPLEHIKIIF